MGALRSTQRGRSAWPFGAQFEVARARCRLRYVGEWAANSMHGHGRPELTVPSGGPIKGETSGN